MTRIVIIGGGPAGYEAALVAAQYGADVTVVEREAAGGACVLHDCVPSKTYLASAAAAALGRAAELGIRVDRERVEVDVDVAAVHGRTRNRTGSGADRARGTAQCDRRRPRPHFHRVSLVVRFDHRGRAPADALRRSGLILPADAAASGGLSARTSIHARGAAPGDGSATK